MEILDPEKQYTLPEPQTDTEKTLDRLQRASLNWYRTKDRRYVEQFHEAYHQLRALGWDGAIDIDTALPDDLMPQEYLDRVSEEEHQPGTQKFDHLISAAVSIVRNPGAACAAVMEKLRSFRITQGVRPWHLVGGVAAVVFWIFRRIR